MVLGKVLIPSSCVPKEKESDSHELPIFSYSIYNLFVDLHNIFNGLPAIRKDLDSATKLLIIAVEGGINEGFNWRTYVPQEVKDMSTEHTVLEDSNFKPMGAVGAAALTLTKVILACKSLAPLKLFWTNTYARGNVLVKSILIRRDNQRSNTEYIIFCSRDELLFRTSYTLYDDNEDKTSKTYRHLTNGYVWS
ncbi:hypothetical protein DY000_02035563 [Brassica cretica]|uniref:Uncharacterized protein n=1 Tax=Brassica cretica TaxID=69181 RepID=A0ABQ7DPR0_BRACR|nr:hypothetical protein DY000_02035563 [Brassica cretica]